jgi:hypothetical protein
MNSSILNLLEFGADPSTEELVICGNAPRDMSLFLAAQI